jgi:hypothetical protein
VHLRDVGAGLGAARLALRPGKRSSSSGVGGALAAELGGQVGQQLGVAALLDPAWRSAGRPERMSMLRGGSV